MEPLLTSCFISANSMPVKVISDPEIVRDCIEHRIRPIHIYLNPTNKCQQNCSFCSCKNRDKSLELDWLQAIDIVDKFVSLGTKAVTLTGGGEPLLYYRIEDLIHLLQQRGCEIGLVTNGKALRQIDPTILAKLTWCRISVNSESPLDIPNVFSLPVDWSFSYVWCEGAKLNDVAHYVRIANENKFTHVRIVDDILYGREDFTTIRDYLASRQLDDSLVIYQGRKKYTKGNPRCLISLIKPNVGPDGYVYPCCGIQYAKNPPSLDLSPDDAMSGSIEDIYANQMFYDGSACDKCYYSEYNTFLNILWTSKAFQHKNFV